MIRRSARRAGLIVVLVGGLNGCAWISSWFSKSPPKAPAPAAVAAAPQAPTIDVDLQPASAARAACANYAKAFEDSLFPRDAIIRGIDSGTAAVRFRVDGTTLTVLTITSSDPAFGDAALRIVRKLECKVDRPTAFEIPFAWRTTR
jgi:outer membrane biosynthesis protein TonB